MAAREQVKHFSVLALVDREMIGEEKGTLQRNLLETCSQPDRYRHTVCNSPVAASSTRRRS